MVSKLHCLGQSLCRENRLLKIAKNVYLPKVMELSNVKDKSQVSTIERENGVYATILTKTKNCQPRIV